MASSGGETIVEQNQWTSGSAFFLGGAVVTFFLADAETGELVAADTFDAVGRMAYELKDNTSEGIRLFDLDV